MTIIAAKLNDWLTPTIRKYLHAAVVFAAAVAGIWGLSDHTITTWQFLVLAVGGLLSEVLSAIVTKRADMSALYVLAAAVITALVAVRFLNPSLADQIDNTLAAVVALFAGVAFTRTNTTTVTGAPATETLAEVTPTVTPTIYFSPAPIADPSIDIVAAAAAHAASVAPSTPSTTDTPVTSAPADPGPVA